MASLLSQLWNDLSQLWTVPKDTTQTLTVSQSQSDAGKGLTNLQSFLAKAEDFFSNKTTAEQKTEDALAVGLDIVQIAAMIDPAIGVGVLPIEILEAIVPWLFAQAAIPLVKVNNNTYVTQNWADSHKLNPDGTFVQKNILGF